MNEADDIRELWGALEEAPARHWSRFIDRFTPTLLAFIERAGVRDRDEVMEIYVMACEHLSENDCARLRRFDPDKGHLSAWLSVVMRHLVTDWIRSRVGRRRLFGAVRELDELHQRVFELYYWEGRSPGEVVEILGTEGRATSLENVLTTIQKLDEVLTERHRGELVSYAAKVRGMSSLAAHESDGVEIADERPDAEQALHRNEVDAILSKALESLPAEDAVIMRLKFAERLSLPEIRRALHLPSLSPSRVKRILEQLRRAVEAHSLTSKEALTDGLGFLEGDSD